MDADIHTLYSSDFYRIIDFKCRCVDCKTSKPEYSDSFCVSFVRKGNFLFNVFRQSLDSYNGCVLVTKPGYERTVTHVHTVPDECTIIDFKNDFYECVLDRYKSVDFLFDNDLHSTLLKTSPELEFLHFHLLKQVTSGTGTKLEIDNGIMEILQIVLTHTTAFTPKAHLDAKLKKIHLGTIERAKDYITRNFIQDISLTEIADHCHVSLFHFSRLFKTFTGTSPHQFLASIRLKHAEVLLKSTALPIMEIAFSSGYNSIEHFTSAFKAKYKVPPAKFRSERESIFSSSFNTTVISKIS